MAHEVLMPKLSSTMETGKITEWFKNEGDIIKQGDPIFEVMTDKIAIEVEAYDEGILLKRYLEVDDEAPVNSIVAYIGKEGEQVPDAIKMSNEGVHEEIQDKEIENEVITTQVTMNNIQEESDKVRATPSARKYAYHNNINLKDVVGTGSRNRIHLDDVKAHFSSHPSVIEGNSVGVDQFVQWGGIRKQIADQMVRSKLEIPHVAMHSRVHLAEVNNMRTELSKLISRKSELKLTLTDIMIYVVSRVLKNHRILNASTQKDGYTLHESVNLGIAVALEAGLIVPVIHNADVLSLMQIAEKRTELVNLSRTNSLKAHDLKGGTFTISSIGKGVIQGFTPVINYPQVAILGIGSTYEDLDIVDNQVTKVERLQLSLSFDHRVVDGYPASLFLEELVATIEKPYNLFL